MSGWRSKLIVLHPLPGKHLSYFPVEAKYPIAPRNNQNAIRFGMMPPMIWASPRFRKVITTKKPCPVISEVNLYIMAKD